MVFTREISVLLAAGVPLDRSLQLLVKVGENGPLKKVCENLLSNVSNGMSLSDAMQDQSEVFPPYYSGMVRAGEAGGALPVVFGRLFEMLEKRAVLSAKVQSALTYPLIILILMAVSVGVLMVLVIPEFKPIFSQAKDDLPWTTEAIIWLSDFTVEYGTIALAVLLAALIGLSKLRLTERQQLYRDQMLLMIPAIGPMLRTLETGRFCRMLGTLRSNGVTLIDAVQISADTLQNRVISRGIRQIIQPLSQGEGISRPLKKIDVLPDLALQLIEVGEESGKLDEMLIQVAEIFDVETDRKIQTALSLLVPLITVFLGLVVAFVIGSILSAMLGSYSIAF